MNTFGENLKLTIFGEARSWAVGMVLDGFPAGFKPDMEALKHGLCGKSPTQTGEDEPFVASGIYNGITDGAPITIILRNGEVPSGGNHPEKPRPGHADLVAQFKYRSFADHRDGGPFSSRLTAAMSAAGGLCLQALAERGVTVKAAPYKIGTACREDENFDFNMQKQVLDARSGGDSIGGVIECVAEHVPLGLGGLMFGGMDSRISAALYAIPGVRGVEFGAGFGMAEMRGSAANDPIRIKENNIYMETNHAGGINGGITNGMPLVLRCAFQPTPSISRSQETVDLARHENTSIRVTGRNDPCIALSSIPAVEGLVAFCILDAMLGE